MKNYNDNNFTMMYEYGVRGGSTLNHDKEYVFACKGRPFAALVSDHFPTPYSTLLDYDLIKKLGLKVTDIQCRKFMYAGHKFRILGRVSTAVQCVQNGRISGNFHIKGLVISDLNQMLDTHCVAGTKMRERIESLTGQTSDDTDEDFSDDELSTSLEGTSQSAIHPEMTPSSSSATVRPSSSQATTGLTGSSHPAAGPQSGAAMTSSSPAVTTVSSSFTMTATTSATTALQSSTSATAAVKSSPSMALPSSFCLNPSGGAMVRSIWTNSASKIQVPDLDNLYSFEWDSKKDPEKINQNFWLDKCLTSNEGRTLNQSYADNQPRVVNLKGLDNKDYMLRVGDWSGLAEPREYQRRHVHLAKIRRVDPDRVCSFCSYFLSHNCHHLPSNIIHCKEACINMHQYNRDRGVEDHVRVDCRGKLLMP